MKMKLSPRTRLTALAACAVFILSTLFGCAEEPPESTATPATTPDGFQAVTAVYPGPTAEKMNSQEFIESDEHWDWWDAYRAKADASAALQSGMEDYYKSLMARLLPSENENTVCSPLNTYIAFAMLAEVTDGNSRKQILDMLGVSGIDALRSNIKTLWEGNYADTPVLKSLLANSLWLKNSVSYNSDTLSRLASDYYASSVSGEPGSAAMDEALQKWTDDNTGGLLKEHTKGMKLNPETVLALVSTIYYKAEWTDHFNKNATTKETFHGASGDTEVDMMHLTDSLSVFTTDTFTSVGLSLLDSGSMYFYLPKEGTDISALASDPDLLAATRWSEDPRFSFPLVNLSVPKFSVSAKTDLLDAIASMGVTDVLDPSVSDFSPLTEEVPEIFLSQAEHAALVEVDEDGVTGAAYTVLAMAAGAALIEDEIDFTLDRPFLFIITGRDGSVLFSGVVNNI
ncbi:MAG: serpin family protein [Lachnospiraceae bacterium]|nr:serpin family protein [Lachnospiraceae bacterium]